MTDSRILAYQDALKVIAYDLELLNQGADTIRRLIARREENLKEGRGEYDGAHSPEFEKEAPPQ